MLGGWGGGGVEGWHNSEISELFTMSTIYIAVMFPINTLTGSDNTKVALNVTCCKEEDAKPYS